jgi:hypothetical protein
MRPRVADARLEITITISNWPRLAEALAWLPEAEKKEDLAQLEAALKTAKPIQFKENITLVLKYFDKLAPIMQEQDSKLRPAV